MSHGNSPASLLRQPKAVYAVAFACVISFMGIGLVDPILPALSHQLYATPAQVSLLFTSYLLVTAVAMLGTNWVSSRIGAKRTLIAGLVIIVVFAGLAGTANGVNGIVGFRAGWGLGNALFIATSLAVIVASASGGFAGAIILYEAALGLGIAVGPLLGSLLGGISWRGPFFGVSALMAIALHQLGLVFTAWGILLAFFSVVVAPRLQERFGTAPTLYVNLGLLAVVLATVGVFTDSPTTVIVATIASGALLGVNNTLTTQAVMTVAPVERPVASAAYGFVRFIGGGLAPYVAGKLA